MLGRHQYLTSSTRYLKELNRIDGEPMEFEWTIFPGFTTLGILEEIQTFMTQLQCEPDQFKGRIIFMSMNNDIEWRANGNKERCEYNSHTVADYAHKFPLGHWSFLWPGSEKKWYGTYSDKPDGSWDRMGENMMMNSSESGHPMFRASSAFERGELRSIGGGKKSIHFNGCEEHIELLLRTVNSANQRSIHGAVADLCNEAPKDFSAPGKPASIDHLGKMET